MRARRRWCLWLMLAAGAAASAAGPGPASIEALAWLAGCWARTDAETGSGESWTAPAGGTMLGTSRTVRDGRTTGHEFMLIGPAGDDGALAYHALPSGQRATVFRLSKLEARAVVFENPAHDFPERIGYRLLGDGRLLAWIEGTIEGAERRIEFPMRRSDCPAAYRVDDG